MSKGPVKFCGLSPARFCIYSLLVVAWTLLIMVVGMNIGRSGGGGVFSGPAAAVLAGGVAAPAVLPAAAAAPEAAAPAAAIAPAPAPPRTLSVTEAFKAPVEHAAKDPQQVEEERTAAAKGFGVAPAHLSQASANHPGAGDIPAGWVYAKDRTSKLQGWPIKEFPVPSDDDLAHTAFITMATGDESARHAVALLQSLRDTNTRIPTVHVMLFRGGAGSVDCNNPFLRKARGRDHINCDSLDTVANEIVSQKYLDAFTRLGATFGVEDPLPESPYTKDIPGGRQIAWGMALNKLKVFSKLEYRKVLWSDADILVLNNIDHLMMRPDFSGAFTNDCCNRKCVRARINTPPPPPPSPLLPSSRPLPPPRTQRGLQNVGRLVDFRALQETVR
jgi:hypothetical protein